MSLTREEFIKLKVENENEKIGYLSYMNCPKCKNKGVIYFEANCEINALECNCVSIRKMIQELEKCGMKKEVFNNYTLEKFTTDQEWQKVVKAKFVKYLENFKKDEEFRNWLVISAQSGSGKSHLCTAILKEMMIDGKKGKYMLWLDEVQKIIALKKSVHYLNQQKFDDIMYELKNVDILYIDDFLKNYNDKKIDEIDIAYEIINARYNNNKITIISTEVLKEQLENINMAICGRINERANGYWTQLKYDKERNYRMKDRR